MGADAKNLGAEEVTPQRPCFAAVEERARAARKSFVFIVIRFVCGLSVAEVCEKLMLFDLVLRRPETSATVKC